MIPLLRRAADTLERNFAIECGRTVNIYYELMNFDRTCRDYYLAHVFYNLRRGGVTWVEWTPYTAEKVERPTISLVLTDGIALHTIVMLVNLCSSPLVVLVGDQSPNLGLPRLPHLFRQRDILDLIHSAKGEESGFDSSMFPNTVPSSLNMH